MISIKDLIFKLLDEIEPNELIDLGMNKHYARIAICRTDSIFPLATSITERIYRLGLDPDTVLGLESVVPPVARPVESPRNQHEYTSKYRKEHTIEYNGNEYFIEEELLDIQFEEDYFSITVQNMSGISQQYFKYDDVCYVKKTIDYGEEVLVYYNRMQYQLYK